MRDLDAGRNGGSSAVNRMKAERIHVVREAARAADAGYDHEFFARNPQLRKHGLHGRENGVISATRTPADFLVRLEILLGQYWNRCRSHWSVLQIPLGLASVRGSQPRSSSIFASISDCLKGCPWILLWPCASTRNLARNSISNWPRFISGTRTWR